MGASLLALAKSIYYLIPYSVSVFVSMIPFPFPDSGFNVLVLPSKTVAEGVRRVGKNSDLVNNF